MKQKTVRVCLVAGAAALANAPGGEGPFGPAAARAQTLDGYAVSADRTRPLAGAFVRLLDPAGEIVAGTHTDRHGAFSLRAPESGEYRPAVSAAGFRDWQGSAVHLDRGRPLEIVLRVPADPIRWSDTGSDAPGRGCLNDPSAQASTASGWEVVRATLQEVERGQRDSELRFVREAYSQRFGAVRGPDGTVTGRALPPAAGPAYVSPAPERLAGRGYVERSGDTVLFHAPDARTLLSRSFRSSHCFESVRELPGRPGGLGLPFRASSAADRADIAGTFRLSPEGMLVELDYRYVGVPWAAGVDTLRAGGWVRYDRIAGHGMFVREWWVQRPIPALAPADSNLAADLPPIEYERRGGRTVSVARGGDVIFIDEGATLRGTVRDSTTGRAVRSQVELFAAVGGAAPRPSVMPGVPPRPVESGTALRVQSTGADGTFVFTGVPPGEYRLRVDHPRLAALGLGVVEVPLRLESGSEQVVEAWLPDDARILPGLCGRALPPSRDSAPPAAADAGPVVETAVVGILRNHDRLRPVAGGEVEASWRPAAGGSTRAITDREGRFVMCGIPDGVDVHLSPTHPAFSGEASVRTDRPVSWADLYVSSGGTRTP